MKNRKSAFNCNQEGIFCIHDTINGRTYIEYTPNIKSSAELHLRLLNKNKHNILDLQMNYNNNEISEFDFIVLKEGEDSQSFYDYYYRKTKNNAYVEISEDAKEDNISFSHEDFYGEESNIIDKQFNYTMKFNWED